MSVLFVILWGLTFGLINTCLLHLAKAMERHGIDIFSRNKSLKEKGKKPIIYAVGFILNYLTFIWQFLGLMFSSAAVFSSVFGIGLIITMLYSHFILKEEIKRPELIGAGFIITGTSIIGFNYIFEEKSLEIFNQQNFFILLIIVVIIFTLFITFSWKTGIGIAFLFGIVAGSLGGMDNVFKRMGFKELGFADAFLGVFRLDIFSIIFLISFLVGFLAFIFTQIGFAKGADASKLVPMYDSFYILMPIIFELVIVVGVTVSLTQIIAILIIVAGIFLMNIFKDPESLKVGKIEMDKKEEK
jgi:drug/metabolite transporter (DMT)-like permease